MTRQPSLARYQLAHLPPSANHIWRHTKSGKTYRTDKYLAWLNAEGWNVKSQMPSQPKFASQVHITCPMRRPRANADLDNRLKGIGDLLQSVGAIADDKQIMGWNAWWCLDLPKGVAAAITIERWGAIRPDARGAKA